MKTPFFSIIIPTYNRANLISKTLRSVLDQEFRDFEVIVVDDGGSDNTKEVVETFADTRVTYHWKENAERGAARNYGLDRATGKWINFFDSDDIAYSRHLLTAWEHIQKDPSAEVFHTSYDEVDTTTGKTVRQAIYTGNLNSRIRVSNYLSCNNVFIKKSATIPYRFSEKTAIAGSEDWLLWLLLSTKYQITGLPEITSAILHHAGRSMITASGKDTELRGICFIDTCREYPELKPLMPNIISEIYSLAGLYYSIGKKRKDALRCALTAFKARPFKMIFSRRSLAIFKHLI
jgi:glycosyltransferase involved in cell wall biosynthesis